VRKNQDASRDLREKVEKAHRDLSVEYLAKHSGGYAKRLREEGEGRVLSA
jgi:hypothetical protein